MLAPISRILTIALALYSYLQLKMHFPADAPATTSATAAKLLFAIQLLLAAVFFLVPYFPESIHFGTRKLSDYTPDQMQRITPLLREMLALMSLLFALYFTANVQILSRQAQAPNPREPARAIAALEPWLVGALIISQAAIIFYYLRRFDAATTSEPADTNIDTNEGA